MVSAWAVRSASMIKCSVWLLTSNVSNAAIVTADMAPISAIVSFLMTGFEFIPSNYSFLLANGAARERSVLCGITCSRLLSEILFFQEI
jgi:hypothetical protein